MSDRMLSYIFGLTLVVLFLVACGAPAVTPTAQLAMATPITTQTPTRTSTATAEGVLDLEQALARGLVEAQISGNGSSSGDSIIVEMTRKVPRALELTIPAGTVLRSKDPAAQNMVVLRVRGVPAGGGKFRPVSAMRLTSDAPQEFLLEAYCLDFDKENPSGDTGFSVGELASPQVQALFEALDKVPAAQRTIGAIQTAIWVVTDDVCERELQARFQVGAADLKAAQDILEAAGVDLATTCLFGQGSAELPQEERVLPTELLKATPTPPTPTMTVPTPVPPADTPGAPAHTPTAAKAGMTVTGDVWQVTVTSVSRVKRIACGYDSTHWADEGYEILEVAVEFAPIERKEEMSVSTENVVLIDNEGQFQTALGGGEPSTVTVGQRRRSSSCCLGGSGRRCVVESYLVQDTLTTSFFFGVEEGKTGYRFQFMDYPPITLSE